jgi:hypothetical protein
MDGMEKFEGLNTKIKRDRLMRILRNVDYSETLITQYIRYFEPPERILKAQTQIKEVRNLIREIYDSIGFNKDSQ